MNQVLWCGVSSFCPSAACRVIRVAPAVVTGPSHSVSHSSCTRPPGHVGVSCTGPPGHVGVSCLLHWPTRPCQCLLHWPTRPCQCLMPPALAHQALSVSPTSCTGPPGLVSVHRPARSCQCLMPPAPAHQALSVSPASRSEEVVHHPDSMVTY